MSSRSKSENQLMRREKARSMSPHEKAHAKEMTARYLAGDSLTYLNTQYGNEYDGHRYGKWGLQALICR